MSIQSDRWIRMMALEHGMIEPFEEKQIRTGISYGLSSYGYDFRIGPEFKIMEPRSGAVVDPKRQQEIHFRDVTGEWCDIPPQTTVLARTIEFFRIPRDVITICFGKSTYARCGVHIHVTPFEPEWEGHATIALSHANTVPTRIYAGEGIGQLLFLRCEEPCAVSYADKQGKYQSSRGITLAKGRG